MAAEVTRFRFRLDRAIFEVFRIEDASNLVGSEVPVTWGEQAARGRVIAVDADERGILVTMEVSASGDASFPAFLAL